MKQHPIDTLEAVAATQAAGQRCVLATLVGVDGSSPRPLGTQMLVRADGSTSGQLSSGCIEQAIVGQAMEALGDGRPRTLRYGQGSPWFDLKLPCGSGLDVHLAVDPDPALVRDTLQRLAARKAVRWRLEDGAWQPTERPAREGFTQLFSPRWQLLAVGRGPVLSSLASIAASCDMAVLAYGPERADLEACERAGAAVQLLRHADQFDCPKLDRHSAAVTLFHDHDWEPPILRALLASNTAHIAAMGSPRAHAARLMELTRLGVKPAQLARIKGPAGIDIHAATPAEIALSITAEIVQRLRAPAQRGAAARKSA